MQAPLKKQKQMTSALRHYDRIKAKQLLTDLIPDVQHIEGRDIYSPESDHNGIAQLRHILRIFRFLDDSDLIETFDGYIINRADPKSIEGISGESFLSKIANLLGVKYRAYSCISTGKRAHETGENIKEALLNYYNMSLHQ